MKGRAASGNPPGRFERVVLAADDEQLDGDDLQPHERAAPTEFFADHSQSLLVENQSPDIPFRYSVNPYRGCEHGCAYCYARPSHEYLGLGAGLDFETKIMVKTAAAELLRRELNRPGWNGELIAISGNTDCYQPIERRLRLTRSLLEVALEARQCVALVTKNVLVTRDLDLLARLAEARLVHVAFSVNTLDAELARVLEPRTSAPAARLRGVEQLSTAGVPVQILCAPVIPGLNDDAIPAVLAAAKAAGAGSASYLLLRLPLTVRPIFLDWLKRSYPDKAPRVEALIRETRGGELTDSQFGRRHRGTGQYAQQIAQAFRVFARKHQLDQPLPALDTSQFRPPRQQRGQMRLF